MHAILSDPEPVPRQADPDTVSDAVASNGEAIPTVGSWVRCAGTVGRVVSINREAFELAVAFGAGNGPARWFLPDELAVIDRPIDAPDIRTGTEPAVVY